MQFPFVLFSYKFIILHKQSLNLLPVSRTKRCRQSHGWFVEEAKHVSLNILQSLQVSRQFGKELLMVKTSPVTNIRHVDAHQCVPNSALVTKTGRAVKNTAGTFIHIENPSIICLLWKCVIEDLTFRACNHDRVLLTTCWWSSNSRIAKKFLWLA